MYKAIIVDDEEDIRYLLRHLLEKGVRDVTVAGEASNGDEGLALCRKLCPEIVLADIRMPGLDGLEMLGQIKKASPHTQVILISGYGYFSYAQRALEQGAAGYLLKPIEEEELYEVVERVKALVLAKRRERDNRARMQAELKKLQQGLHTEVLSEAAATVGHEQVRKALHYIHENYCTEITLERAADTIFMNAAYFSVLFKKETGKSFVSYVNDLRMKQAKQLMLAGKFKVAEIAHMTGFNDVGYFNRVFKKYYGRCPKEYQSALRNPINCPMNL